MFEVTAPFKLPQPMAMPRTALRLYEPSTLLETHALRNGEFQISVNVYLVYLHRVCCEGCARLVRMSCLEMNGTTYE